MGLSSIDPNVSYAPLPALPPFSFKQCMKDLVNGTCFEIFGERDLDEKYNTITKTLLVAVASGLLEVYGLGDHYGAATIIMGIITFALLTSPEGNKVKAIRIIRMEY
ncbi:hypothetical protein [Criblamydia sequanensis]|uniref:Membrane protein n=1 Tax=Candidatus Criblamydia sequanensis CRIB-18 TaxID=1437425 RepID=A0A090D1Q3_9BACT|nr:hypothetical protein [Criblamydia sequanensis]CDR33663.1 putative membrane protein [Criblamydia sequanensis CRIB-18]